MTKLSLRLMGPFQAVLDGVILTDFRSNKVSGLLAYLVIESQRPWTRSFLADLFWPDFPEDKAQSNLSNALWNLRSLLGDSDNHSNFIIVHKSTIQFNERADFWVDVKAFTGLVEKIYTLSTASSDLSELSDLEETLSKFEGSFMDGFFIDSPVFETWIGKTRQGIRQEKVNAFRCLSQMHLQNGKFAAAQNFTMKWIEFEPWDEEAYRQAMKIFNELGQRKKALDLYDQLHFRLAEDLGMEPQHETIQLYQEIHLGVEGLISSVAQESIQTLKKEIADSGPIPVSFSQALLEDFDRRPFFGHKVELTQLQGWKRDAFSGHGKAAFIIGEPGSGKSYLLTEFANQVLKDHPNSLLLWGQCNAYTGQGDPYFPFMTIIKTLVGNFEPLTPGLIINLEHLNRLWLLLPDMLANLINLGPNLIKRFIIDGHQFSLAQEHPGVSSVCLDALETLIEEAANKQRQRVALNDEFTQVLSALSEDHPILLVLDDLQWIDEGSANLLFHLGRQLGRKKILLLGAFRPSEVSISSDKNGHPLSGILKELQAIYGESLINLAHSQGKTFINELLSSEPNAFTPGFNQMLYDHTSGHPLFSIELLRGMQLRNEILRDKHGKWVESDYLDWGKLPTRVEAVIARRFDMLPSNCQALMIPACVQGEIFSVEVLSHVLKITEKKVFELLNGEVCKRHRLILPLGVQKVGDARITLFRFRHALFQIYLYSQLNEIEKVFQHGLIAKELEEQYKNHLAEYPQMTHSIARHFELAQLPEKAVQYFKLAGDDAMLLTAHQEAINHYYHAIDLLKGLLATSQRDQIELGLQLSLGPPLTALKGWGPPELEKAYDRAQILCESIDDSTKLVPTLWLLGTFRLGRSEHTEVDRLVSRMYRLAQKTNDPALIALANIQVSPLYQGRFNEARYLLERPVTKVDIDLQSRVAQRFGMAPAVVSASYLYNCLWLMGFPEQADLINQQAFHLAKKINHPMTTCYVTSRAGWFAMVRDNPNQVKFLSDQLLEVSTKHGFKNFELAALFFKHWLNLQDNKLVNKTIDAMKKILDDYIVTKTVLNRTVFLIFFAKACAIAGQQKLGFDIINECIALGEKTGELWFQAEAWRIKGELIISGNNRLGEKDDLSEALLCFKDAYKTAQEQGGKMWELRAAMSLAKFYASQAQPEVGRELLQETYDWFTEGFETKELQQARMLLNSLK